MAGYTMDGDDVAIDFLEKRDCSTSRARKEFSLMMLGSYLNY